MISKTQSSFLTAAALLVSLAIAQGFASDSDVDYPVAFVNNSKIMKSHVDQRLAFIASHSDAAAPATPFAEALQVEIDRALLLQDAEKSVDSSMKDRVRAVARRMAAGVRNPRSFTAEPDDAKVDLYYRDVLLQTYLSRKTDRVGVTPAQVRDFYEQHPEYFTVDSSVTISQILVRVDARTDDEARAVIEDAAARLAAGADFAQVARDLSEGPYAKSGGLWPPQPPGSFIPDVSKIVGELAPGRTSAPFRTPLGWHIVKLEQSSTGGLVPFDDVQERIHDELKSAAQRQAQDQLIKELRAKAVIKIIGA